MNEMFVRGLYAEHYDGLWKPAEWVNKICLSDDFDNEWNCKTKVEWI